MSLYMLDTDICSYIIRNKPPDWAKHRLASASSEQLDQWAERVLEAKSLQDVWVE
ncbi:hypothetical protein [Desulforhabdus sp. TSK]|uniref:hypothetical protein n=1 Tax=Desulforhabdus sp. TSK TaxID=2925014 RepID=UPI001FC8AE42|nr:hypothetical protein [Desulforhabdus sp. TSK]GKT08902.1 hypothetical protein DSTSK_22070 [Desulforhabdus sp. TSK]